MSPPCSGRRCPTSTGRASTAMSAASWCWGRSRAGRPASASRSARASAARRRRRCEPQRVDDVHAFPGHIACDAACRSELVVPIVADGAPGRRARSRQPDARRASMRKTKRAVSNWYSVSRAARRHGKGGRRRVKDRFTRPARRARVRTLRTGDPGHAQVEPFHPGGEHRAHPVRRLRAGPPRRRRATRARPQLARRRRHGGGTMARRQSAHGGSMPVAAPASRRHGFVHPGAQFPAPPAAARLRHPRPSGSGRNSTINNWQIYGFADPGPDRRWVRYYDDAYLIDRDGRVRRRALRPGLGPLWRGVGGRRTASPPIAAAATIAPATRIMPGPRSMAGDDGRAMRHGGDMAIMAAMAAPWRSADGRRLRPWRHGLWRRLRLWRYAYPIVIETTTTTGADLYRGGGRGICRGARPRRRAAPAAPRCACPAPRPRPRPAPARRAPPPAAAGERG